MPVSGKPLAILNVVLMCDAWLEVTKWRDDICVAFINCRCQLCRNRCPICSIVPQKEIVKRTFHAIVYFWPQPRHELSIKTHRNFEEKFFSNIFIVWKKFTWSIVCGPEAMVRKFWSNISFNIADKDVLSKHRNSNNYFWIDEKEIGSKIWKISLWYLTFFRCRCCCCIKTKSLCLCVVEI